MKDLKQKSKFLSLVLRHKPEQIGLNMDANGWVYVDELLQKCNRNKFHLDFKTLVEIVETNDKKRFIFSEDQKRIRANQGHTVEVDLEFVATTPPDSLYHGTVENFIDSIKEKGLNKMKRLHVHLSKDIETALKVGSRRGKPIILKIDASKMAADGFPFYLSANGVWLCDEVPFKYISIVR